MDNVFSAASHGLTAAVFMALGLTVDDSTLLSRRLLMTSTTPRLNGRAFMLTALEKFGTSFTARGSKNESRPVSSQCEYNSTASPTSGDAKNTNPFVTLDPVTRAWADERASQHAEAKAHRLLSGPLRFEDTLTLTAGSHKPSLPLLVVQTLVLATDKERLCTGLWDTEVVWDSTHASW